VEKVQKTKRFVSAFPDYGDVGGCVDFLVEKVREAAGRERHIEVLTQCAIDAENVIANANKICRYIRERGFGKGE
jgi:hypothetical protein